MTPLLSILGLAFIGSVAGLIGGVLFFVKESWCKTLTFIAVPLAAGVLLALSLTDLLPEAVEQVGSLAFTIVLIVFIVSFLIERFLFSFHHHDHHSNLGKHEGAVSLVIFGDTIHNFLDGVAIATAFLINPSLGLFVALATFLHETPHEIADFGILVANGWSKQKAFVANFFSALATFPGAILAYIFSERIEGLTGVLLAVAAGLFLYVATTDFLPEVALGQGKSSFKQALFLIIGILAIVLLGFLVPEIHG